MMDVYMNIYRKYEHTVNFRSTKRHDLARCAVFFYAGTKAFEPGTFTANSCAYYLYETKLALGLVSE